MIRKILFDHSIFLHQKIGGISNYIFNLNKNLNKIGLKSVIFAPISISNLFSKKNKHIINFYNLKSLPLFTTRISYLINNIVTLIYIFLKKPDLVHLSYYNNFLIKFIKIPYVLTIYDLIHERLNIHQKKFDKRFPIQNAKKIICISNQTKNDLIKFYKVKKNKIKVIYLGINQQKILYQRKKKYIIYVGAREGYKNFNNFILAYSRSEFLKKNYKILSFGHKDFIDKEKNFFKNLKILNKISYISGDYTRLNKIYSQSSLLVSPSLLEGFGLPPLEAMRCGCPVATSNIKIFREIYGNASIFFNPKNVTDIKNKIEKILKSTSLQKRQIAKGYRKFKEFKWSKCAVQTLNVYKSLN